MLQVVSKKTRKKMTEKREENEGFPEPGGKNDNRENGIRKQLLKKIRLHFKFVFIFFNITEIKPD